MEYCCHVWASAPSCYLELLDKLEERICKTGGPSFSAPLEPLAHHRNGPSLNLFYGYYFGRCSSELAELVPFRYSRGRSTRYSDRLHDFSVTLPRCYKDVYLRKEVYTRKSRINRHLLTTVDIYRHLTKCLYTGHQKYQSDITESRLQQIYTEHKIYSV